MFSTLKRRVKKIMKKIEEVVEIKEMVKLEVLDMMRSGTKRIYEDITKTLSENKIATGIAIGAWFIISELTNNKRGD